jgi:hypothetical protein
VVPALMLVVGFGARRAEAAEAAPLAGWTLYEENDVFAHSDRYYTQGLKFAWSRIQGGSPWLEDHVGGTFWNWLDRGVPANMQGGWSIGQNIYTPRDIKQRVQDPDDRPWAGWLYLGRTLSITNECAEGSDGCIAEQHQFELDLGVVGELSAARWTQTEFHKLIDSPKPQGWDNQIGNEPGVLALYRGRWRFGGSHLDVTPTGVVALGNVLTYAGGGATARLGWNLSRFPTDLIPGVLGVARPGWEAFLFAGGEGRGVLRNIFLDGNTLRDSYSVDKRAWVYDLTYGGAARYKGWQLTYTRVRRSPEFDARSGRDVEFQEFGSYAISWSRWAD